MVERIYQRVGRGGETGEEPERRLQSLYRGRIRPETNLEGKSLGGKISTRPQDWFYRRKKREDVCRHKGSTEKVITQGSRKVTARNPSRRRSAPSARSGMENLRRGSRLGELLAEK